MILLADSSWLLCSRFFYFKKIRYCWRRPYCMLQCEEDFCLRGRKHLSVKNKTNLHYWKSRPIHRCGRGSGLLSNSTYLSLAWTNQAIAPLLSRRFFKRVLDYLHFVNITYIASVSPYSPWITFLRIFKFEWQKIFLFLGPKNCFLFAPFSAFSPRKIYPPFCRSFAFGPARLHPISEIRCSFTSIFTCLES